MLALFTAVAEMHPGYMWNQDGTRIRCHGCREVMDADEATAQSVYAGHQGRAYRPFAEELVSLRGLVTVVAAAVDQAGDRLPHAFLTDLAGAFAQVEDATGSHGAALALNTVNRHLDALLPEPEAPPAETADETSTAPQTVEQATAPEPEPPAPVEPPAVTNAPTAPAKAPAAVAALDWMGELPESSAATDTPARKPRKKKEWTPKQTVPVFDEDNRAVMASVVAGDRVRARFITETDGDFTIEATVIAGAAGKSLIAGSMVVSAAGEPGHHLHSVTILEPAGEPAFTPSTEPEHFGLSA